MITESFLNSCFSLLLNKNSTVKRSRALYRDVLEVLNFSEKKDSIDIAVGAKNKLDLLNIITKMLTEEKSIQNIFDSVVFSDKFKQHKDFLDMMINDDKINISTFQDTISQIRLRKKIGALFQNYDELDKVLTSIKDGTFDSIDSLVDDYEVTIKTLYSNMMESNRALTIEAAASLDLVHDNYDHVIEMIKRKYDKSSCTPTGFKFFDDSIMNGGYEPSRLYVYGGGSGAGKSTIMNNSIYKSAMTPLSLDRKVEPKVGNISRVYIYVTLENTIEEALMRTYMPMFDKTIVEFLGEVGSKKENIKERVSNQFAENGTTVIMKYFPAMSISPVDLMGVVDEVIDIYGKEAIAGLFVDYLDLLKADTRYDMYRLELGHITLSLKTLAVQYNIPVITASQLGRSAYRISNSADLGVDQISESIKKVEHADFVMLLAKDPVNDAIVHGKVGKNRAGKSNVAVDFNVDFERFKFDSINPLSNANRSDATTKANVDGQTFAFGGLTI